MDIILLSQSGEVEKLRHREVTQFAKIHMEDR